MMRNKKKVFIFVNEMNERLMENFIEASKYVSLSVISISNEGQQKKHKLSGNQELEFEISVLRKTSLFTLFQSGAPDLVLVLGWNYEKLHLILLLKSLFGFRLVVASDSGAQDYTRSASREAVKKTLLKAGDFGWAAHARAASYFKALSMPTERLFVGGLDTVDVRHFIKSLEEAEKKLSDQKKLITVCRLSPEKNLSLLIEAFSEFLKTRQNWSLSIVGDGPLRESVYAKIQSLDMQQHIDMIGQVSMSELPSHYHQASVFILASTREPWGVVVNEAAACQLPLLVSNRAGSSDELVRPGENGFVFEPDKQGILDALEKMDARSDDWPEMGRVSRALSLEHGSEQYGKAIAQIVDKAMALKRRRVPVSSLLLAFAIAAKRHISQSLGTLRS